MPFNYNREVIDLIESSVRNFKALPLNLGAIPGSGGGEGAPPGGYIGWLPQTRVAYDIEELATLDTSVSGSILDNLNHIRYRLAVIESGGGAGSGIIITDDNNSLFYTDTINLHFVGSGVLVTDLGGGEVRVEIDATGSGGGGSTTFLGLTDTPNSYVGQTGKLVAVNSGETALEFIAPGISDAPSDGTTYGRRNAAWIAVSGGSGTPLTVEDSDGSPTVTNVDKIVFSGAVITDLGSGDVLVAFSGTSSEQILHYYNDDLTSQIPSTTFTTTNIYSSGTLRVYYNGVRQRKGVHYVDDVSFTTFSTYFMTYSGDSIVVDYDYYLSSQTGSSWMIDGDGILITDSDGNQLTESL